MKKIIALTMSSDDRDAQKVPSWADAQMTSRFKWTDDFAWARNRSLVQAIEYSDADWALWLDTDMHYTEDSHDIHSELDNVGEDVAAILLPELGGRYSKECLIRLRPRMGTYIGRTHEFFDTRDRRIHLPGPCFWEDDKTPEQLRHKLDRDLRLLLEMQKDDPKNGRTNFYLGDTLYNLGEKFEAEVAFIRALATSIWDEERAWSAYRVASILFEQDDYDGCLEYCVTGLRHFPSMTELYWLAGVASFWNKEYRNAFVWATQALHAEAMTSSSHFKRWGFTFTPALYEGPWNVLRYAAKRLGEDEAAELLNKEYDKALANRLRQERGG